MKTLNVTEKELAMICDALYTTATCYRRSSQSHESQAAGKYDELARRIGGGCQHVFITIDRCSQCGQYVGPQP